MKGDLRPDLLAQQTTVIATEAKSNRLALAFSRVRGVVHTRADKFFACSVGTLARRHRGDRESLRELRKAQTFEVAKLDDLAARRRQRLECSPCDRHVETGQDLLIRLQVGRRQRLGVIRTEEAPTSS